MGTIKTTNIEPIADNGTVTLGSSGDTFTVPSGVTMVNNGTQTGFGGVMTPAFEAILSSSASINHNTPTKVQCNTEIFDTAGAYDNSTNYRFTPQTAGKYLVYSKVRIDTTAANCEIVVSYIYKNGSSYTYSVVDFDSNDGEGATTINSSIIDMNGSSDYVELYAFGKAASGGGTLAVEGASSNYGTVFGAYKIIE
jgi:hypothetical protein